MKVKNFDYYIYLDYSENLVGYNIIEKEKIPSILPNIVKFRHYKGEIHKRIYLIKIKREIKKSNLRSLMLKQKIGYIKDNLILFAEVLEFVKKNDNCIIFMSVDNNQYNAFLKLFRMIPHQSHVLVLKESDLKKESVEYKLSLIIDTMLNIERLELSK